MTLFNDAIIKSVIKLPIRDIFSMPGIDKYVPKDLRESFAEEDLDRTLDQIPIEKLLKSLFTYFSGHANLKKMNSEEDVLLRKGILVRCRVCDNVNFYDAESVDAK